MTGQTGCDENEDRNIYVEFDDLVKQLTTAIGKEGGDNDRFENILTTLPPPHPKYEEYVWTPYKETLSINDPENVTVLEENQDKSDKILNTAFALVTQLTAILDKVQTKSSSKFDDIHNNISRSSSNSGSNSNDAVISPSINYMSPPPHSPTTYNVYGGYSLPSLKYPVSSTTQRPVQTYYTIPTDPPDHDYNDDLSETTSEPLDATELFNRYLPLIIVNTIAYLLASILFGTFIG